VSLLGDRLEGPRVALEAAGDGEYRVVRAADGEPLGRVDLTTHGDALVVSELCIDPAHRGFGAGSGVAALVRDAWEREPRWRILRGFAPPSMGLAVYFWMRMGLRPIPGDGPEGGLTLERRK
jgi:GNAT superfamily N-acetyltransferase